MKKNLNIIQINGIRGLIIAVLVACCLVAGFIAFPGWVCMHIWNFGTSYTTQVPTIGLFQGVILWGIIITTYFTFKKDRLVICVKSPQGLNEEELKAVFADLKEKSTKEELILKSMLKARETELKLKAEDSKNNQQNDLEVNSESNSELHG